MPKILSKSEAVILLNSEFSAMDYSGLVACIKENGSTIDSFPDGISNALFQRIIGSCMAEWRFDEHTDSIPVTPESEFRSCQLCGAKTVDHLYVIRNRLNDKKLWVGSSCVMKYKPENYEQIGDIRRRQRETKYYEALSVIFPGIVENFFHHGQAYFRNTEYILPLDLESKNLNIFTSVRKLAKEYITSNDLDKPKIIQLLRSRLSEYEASKTEIDTYQTDNANDWLYPKRAHIKNMPPKKIRELLKTMRINKHTLEYYYDPFIAQTYVLPRLNKSASSLGVHFSGTRELFNNVAYIGEINSYQIEIDHRTLAVNYGECIVSEKDITMIDQIHFLSLTTVTHDQQHFYNDEFQYIKRWGMKVVSYAPTYNHAYIYKDGYYNRVPLDILHKIIRPYVLSGRNLSQPNSMIRLIDRNGLSMDRQSYDERLRMASFLHGYDDDSAGRIDPAFIILES